MLDDLNKIAFLDKGNILGSIEHLPEQIQNAWDAVRELEIPEEYTRAKNIIVAGMGGSALEGRIINHLEFNSLRVPMNVETSYFLPNYVNEDSLVILSSYSGNTEETISAAHDAIKRHAKIIGIATGGELAEILEKEKVPFYKIDPVNNPSNQPRMSLGYSTAGVLGILSRLNFITLHAEEIKSCVETAEKFVKHFGVRTHTKENHAKKIAEKLAGKIPVIMSSEHLIGVAHAFKNQINENAKNFSVHFQISEVDHHLMEGLRYPGKSKELLHFLFFESKNYYERISKRYPITQDVIKQNGYGYEVYKSVSEKRHEEVFEILVLGSYVSFYMAMLHGINPAPIPWVDYFKKKMDN